MQTFLCRLLTFVLLFTLSACHQLTKVKTTTYQDQFEGTKTVLMEGNAVKIDGAVANTALKTTASVLSGGFSVPTLSVHLNLEKHSKPDTADQYAIIATVKIKDDAQFYIDNGESLVFLVDGQRIGLTTSGEFNEQRSPNRGRRSSSNARYPVTPAQVQAILNGEQIRFRLINGGFMERSEEIRDKKNNVIEGQFTEKNKIAWRDFFQAHMR